MTSHIRFLVGWSACVILCFGIWTDVRAASSYVPIPGDPVEESWRWRTFHELEGHGLSCLTEGPDGSVLFGTDDGVRVYNGLRWGVYQEEDGIVGAPVNTLLTAKDGTIYAGTETSLLKFDGSNWTTAFPPEGDLHWRFTDLEEAGDGSIWAATNWGALNINNGAFYLYTTDAIGRAVRQVAPYLKHSVVPEEYVPKRSIQSRIGLLSSPAGEGGVAENLLVYAVMSGGPAEKAGIRPGDRIMAVDGQPLLDPNTALIGRPGTTVHLDVLKKGQTEPTLVKLVRDTGDETFRPFVVYDVKAMKDGSVWFGMETGEIMRFQYLFQKRGATGLWHLYTAADGLHLGELPRIGQSPDGHIWAASYTQQGGLNRFDGAKWDHTRISSIGGSDLNTSFATTPDGAFWVGGNTLSVLRRGTWATYNRPDLFPTQRTQLLVTSDGALWVAGLGQYVSRLSLGSDRWQSYEGLNYQGEDSKGRMWFLSEDDGVVSREGDTWTRYDAEDGVVAHPSAVYITSKDVVWVVGSHGGSAATAIRKGSRFERVLHPELSWNVEARAVLEDRDGAMWFGAWVDIEREKGQVGGVLQYRKGKWTHFKTPDAPEFSYGIAQTKDGMLWFCGEEVKLYDGKVWLQLREPAVISRDWTDAIHTTAEGDLWIGTRTHGVYHYDGSTWRAHSTASGLAGNRVYSIVGNNGRVYVATDRGVSLYDGSSWVTYALSQINSQTVGGLQTDSRGGLWVSTQGGFRARAKASVPPTDAYEVSAIRYQPDKKAPDTEILVGANRISSPGNTVFSWRGYGYYKDTADDELQFAWRLNGGPWSRFETKTYELFLNLEDGKYDLEVVARDRDLNVDPTPAKFSFVVGN